uniref:Putative secreted metalloprotease n=1 Tax=Ixodes ricinus TaxID=34613 RepID=A0A6B0VCT1_IXORI
MLEVYTMAFLCAIICVNVDCGPLPEHIVYPKLLETRGINGQKVLHIKNGLTLNLEKLSVLADSLVFTENNNGFPTETIMNGTELEENLYQDRKKMAAVAVKKIDDTIEVKGVLSNNLRIAPLPLMARSEGGHLAHRIYGVEPSMYHEGNDPALPDTLPEEHARTKRRTRAAYMKDIPNLFVVEVHVMVDEYHYSEFDRREDLVTYFALTIVLVNMRYEHTSNPRIQFLLTSIQKEKGFAQTFVDYDIDWHIADRTYAEANVTFNHLLEKYGRSPADITVAVTGLLLADEDSYLMRSRVQGQARLGGVCNVNYSMVMVEDVPMSFKMVSLLPHELGHALGAPHDGLTYMWNECLPPRNSCRRNSDLGNFIMHPSKPGNVNFSDCSKEHMAAFISTLPPSCFDLKTKQNCTTEVKELPGVSANLTNICKRAHPNFLKWNVNTDRLKSGCRFECCSPIPKDSREEATCDDHHLPDGADCGGGKRCVRGKCGYYDKYGAPTTRPQDA